MRSRFVPGRQIQPTTGECNTSAPGSKCPSPDSIPRAAAGKRDPPGPVAPAGPHANPASSDPEPADRAPTQARTAVRKARQARPAWGRHATRRHVTPRAPGQRMAPLWLHLATFGHGVVRADRTRLRTREDRARNTRTRSSAPAAPTRTPRTTWCARSPRRGPSPPLAPWRPGHRWAGGGCAWNRRT